MPHNKQSHCRLHAWVALMVGAALQASWIISPRGFCKTPICSWAPAQWHFSNRGLSNNGPWRFQRLHESLALHGLNRDDSSPDLELQDWEDDWNGDSQPGGEDELYSLEEFQQDFGPSGLEALPGQGADAGFDMENLPQDISDQIAEALSNVQGVGQKWNNISLNETWMFQVAQVPGSAAEMVSAIAQGTESDEAVETFQNGHSLWPGSIVLSRWLAIHPPPQKLAGKTVVEIGAGLGLPGVTAALLGAETVVIQDYDTRPLQVAMETAVENGVARQVKTLQCRWQDLPEQLLNVQEASVSTADVFLGSEVLFNETASGEIADVLNRLLQHSGQVAYILDNYKGQHQRLFKKQCLGHGLELKESEIVTWEPDQEDGNTEGWVCLLMTIRRV